MSAENINTNGDSELIETYLTESQIQDLVLDLAKRIEITYEDDPDTPLILIGVLNGAAFLTCDLVRNIDRENLLMDFISSDSYGEKLESSGEPMLNVRLKTNIEGMNVVIVEDISDTGNTLEAAETELAKKNPKSIRKCSLISKPAKREKNISIDFVGIEIMPPEAPWLEGYGLDSFGKGRGRKEIVNRKDLLH